MYKLFDGNDCLFVFTCHGITFDNYINVTEKYISVVIFQYNSYI